MPRNQEDKEREDRITMEIIVDAYSPEEQAMGWYYYLADNLGFPFTGRCARERHISPVKVGEEVNVIKMASEDDCIREMFVEIKWSNRTLAVPLSQIEPMKADIKTQEAIEDWHYWVSRGYKFG